MNYLHRELCGRWAVCHEMFGVTRFNLTNGRAECGVLCNVAHYEISLDGDWLATVECHAKCLQVGNCLHSLNAV